eukprot:9884587-Lingulodinium_polyedra.AAC.1
MLATTRRPAMRASATAMAQFGSFRRRKVPISHSCPILSKAFSWSASVIAGTRPMKCAAGSSELSNSEQRASMAGAAGPRTAFQRGAAISPSSAASSS